MADQTTGPRMLTSEEISEVCGTCRANSAIETWIKRAIRRYCHVNRLPMPVEDTDGVAERHPRCGYPYCACVGECFAASQPGVTAGVLGTSADQSKG